MKKEINNDKYICYFFCFIDIYYWNIIIKVCYKSQHKNLYKITDQRVKLTKELVETISLLKMYTWEEKFKEKIIELREKE